MKIDLVNFIKINDKKATYGFTVFSNYLEGLKHLLDGEDIEVDFGQPHLLTVTNELLETLNEKIVMESPPEDIPKTKFIEIMHDIWRLTEYRNHLDKNNDIENEWLAENEVEIIARIKKSIDALNAEDKSLIFEIIDEKKELSKNEIIKYMNEKIGILI